MQKLIIVLSLFFLATLKLSAQQPEIFSVSGKAIGGYDAVAYFTEGKATQGDSQFIHSWRGADWQFISAGNLNAFKKNPEKYAPQFGGYCAYGMSKGYKAPTEKDAWSIVNGKLYLNYNRDVQKMWNEKQADYIQAADKNWLHTKNK